MREIALGTRAASQNGRGALQLTNLRPAHRAATPLRGWQLLDEIVQLAGSIVT
jgi:hypothetical protein